MAAAADARFQYDVVEWDLTDPSSRVPDPIKVAQYLRFWTGLRPGGNVDERWTTGGGAPRISTNGYNFATLETSLVEETIDEKRHKNKTMRIEPTVVMAVSATVSGNDPSTFGPDDVYGFAMITL